MNILYPSEAEVAIIGILAGGTVNDLSPMDAISPSDFSNADAGCVFAACKAIRQRRERISLEGLDKELTHTEGAKRADALRDFVLQAHQQQVLQGWQLPHHVCTISEAAQRRALVRIGEQLARNASDAVQDVSAILDASRTALRENVRSRGSWVGLDELVIQAFSDTEKMEKPYSTGMRGLDRMLRSGLHRGEFTIIGARPAVGKSAALLHIARTVARNGAKALFVSLEMSGAQIGARVLAAKSGINAGLLSSGQVPSEAWADLADGVIAVGNDSPANLSVLARGGLTLEELRSEVQTMADAGKCDVLFVDYLQLLKTKQRTNSEFERLGIVSRGLKAITLDLNIPVIAAAQVKRQGTNGGALRAPGLDELRGSGDLEQDADVVLLLHRPESSEDAALKSRSYAPYVGAFENLQDAGKQLLTVEIAKQRQGATGRVWMAFDPAHSLFADLLEVGA